MERAMPAVVRQLEEPRVGQSYPNYYVARLASKFVKVVLSGSGGDEMFGGYPWRYFANFKGGTFDEYVNQYYAYWHRLVSNSQLRQLFEPIKAEVADIWTISIFKNVLANHPNDLCSPSDFLNHSLYFEAKTFLHGLLVVEDKLSMAHGLETRVPFLDNDLVDFAMACPAELKVRNIDRAQRINENDLKSKKMSTSASTDGKRILRDVMTTVIPASITNGAKQGFSSPDASWFKGESIDFVRRKLLGDSPKLFSYFDRSTLSTLVEEHLSGTINRRLLLWSLLTMAFILDEED